MTAIYRRQVSTFRTTVYALSTSAKLTERLRVINGLKSAAEPSTDEPAWLKPAYLAEVIYRK